MAIRDYHADDLSHWGGAKPTQQNLDHMELRPMGQPLQHQKVRPATSTIWDHSPIKDDTSIESTLKMLQEARSHWRRVGFALDAAEGEIRRLSGYYNKDEQL